MKGKKLEKMMVLRQKICVIVQSYHLVRPLNVETCKGFEKCSSKMVLFNIDPLKNVKEMSLQNNVQLSVDLHLRLLVY